jgi:hypothetical protein
VVEAAQAAQAAPGALAAKEVTAARRVGVIVLAILTAVTEALLTAVTVEPVKAV